MIHPVIHNPFFFLLIISNLILLSHVTNPFAPTFVYLICVPFIFLNLGFGWLIAVSYELERFQITTFIYQRLLAITNNRRQIVETSNSQLNNERDMYISVSDELRNTISNCAHDLTSPCSAVGLAVESILKTMLLQSLESPVGLQDTEEIQSVLEVLWDVYYAMMTLHMIINRATDYNKVITGVKLVPSPRPVDIRECLLNVIHSCGTLRVVGSVRRMESSAQLASHSISNVDLDDPDGNDIAPLHDPGVIALSNIQDDVPEDIMTDFSWLRDNLMCIIGNAVKYSVASVLINVKAVSIGGIKMLEIGVQDSGADKLSSMQLKALFDRPIQFARENVGGMGVGLFCMGERCKALGGESGARLRLDGKPGTVVWFRIPLEPCPPGKKATKSELFMLKEQQLERYHQTLCANKIDRGGSSASASLSKHSSHKSTSKNLMQRSASQKPDVIHELNKSMSRQTSTLVPGLRKMSSTLSPFKAISAAMEQPPPVNNNNNNQVETNKDSKSQIPTPRKAASKTTPDESRGSPRASTSPRGSLKATPTTATTANAAAAALAITLTPTSPGGRKSSQENANVTNVMAIEGTLAVATGPLTGLHILAVDDSAAILKMMVSAVNPLLFSSSFTSLSPPSPTPSHTPPSILLSPCVL